MSNTNTRSDFQEPITIGPPRQVCANTIKMQKKASTRAAVMAVFGFFDVHRALMTKRYDGKPIWNMGHRGATWNAEGKIHRR